MFSDKWRQVMIRGNVVGNMLLMTGSTVDEDMLFINGNEGTVVDVVDERK